MKRNPLIRFVPARLALLVAPLLAAWPQHARAADGAFNGATGATWHTVSNWTPNTAFPGEAAATVTGEGLPTDIASTAAANAATNIGINMNTLGGQLTLGAIDWNKTNTSGTTIGNNSTTSSGILQLNGTTVNGVPNTILRCNNEANLALSNVNTGTAAVTMGVRLGTANGIIFVGQNTATTPALRTLTINSAISEATAGNGFTKTGTGNLTLTAANSTSGLITVSDGGLRLQNAAAAGTSDIWLTNGDGAAVNNNDVLLSGGLIYSTNITIENTTNQNARTRLQSSNVVNANANIWNGTISFKGPGVNQTLIADSAPLTINGNLQQHSTPSASIFVRGGNSGAINGNIFLGTGNLFKTDGGSWTINSTGNTMGVVQVADGLLVLNNNDALEPDTALLIGQGSATTGRLQINAGFTQQLVSIGTPTGSSSPVGHSIFGPGTIDFGALSRTINVNDNAATLTELTIHAPITGSGGFVKTGTGNLFLNGAVSGPVTVDAGGLSGLGGNATIANTLTVNNGAIVGAGTLTSAGTLSCTGITLGALTNVVANAGSGGSDLIASSGPVTSAGTTFNITPNGSLMTGEFIPLISYTGTSPGTAPFTVSPALGTYGSRASVTLTDSGSAIGIQVDSADRTVWTGSGGTAWDIATTSNWKLASDNSSTTFQQYDALVFDDTGTNTAIVLNAAATPARAEFTNTTAVPYGITGTGSLGGFMVLDKNGDGQVTLNTNNTYTGATRVNSGTLTANYNTGTAVTPIPAVSPVTIATGAKLQALANDAALALAPSISGTGTLEINCHATAGSTTAQSATITGDNSFFYGPIVLLAPASGTWRVNNPAPAALGSGPITVESGAQLFLTSRTVSNPITITGSGFADTNGFLGALRIDNSTYSGNVTVTSAGGRINAHNSTGTVSGSISGGPLEVNVSNYPNSSTVIFTGENSYTTTVVGGVGGVTPQSSANISMRLNIGNGGTLGTLGSGAVSIIADGTLGASNGTNGVLGFDRADGYTLAAGNTITAGGGNLSRTFIDVDCTGTGLLQNGAAINLGTASTGGNIRIAQARANASATLNGTVSAGQIRVSTGQTGGVLNINTGADVTANQLYAGEATGMSGIINMNDGTVSIAGQVRVGHFGNEYSTFNMSGGSLILNGDSPNNTPSTSGAGSANTTGDNNINALPANAIVGGGIYIGIDGTGDFNHIAGTVTTNWIVLDNRGNTTATGDGIDRYDISGSALLKLRSEWGIIARNTTTAVSLGGGTIQLDNTGTGGPVGNTGADLDVPIQAALATVNDTTTTLDTGGADNSFILSRDITGTGALDLTGGGTIELNSATTQNVSAILTGSASLVKNGAGTTILTGASGTYAGATSVNQGTLRVDGALGNPVTIQSGATLAGSGSTGSITALSGGIIAPGASAGTLTAASADLQNGSRYDAEITAAATSDKLAATGSITVNGAIHVILSGYVPVAGDSFDIADAASFSGTPTFDFTAAVLSPGLAWDTSSFLTSGVISVTGSDPFDAWATANSVTGGKGGDDDNDGASNLLEFATNANPASGGSGARAYPKLAPLGGDLVLTLTVATRKNSTFAPSGATQTATKDRVLYTIEGTSDLTAWSSTVTELNPADSTAVQSTLGLPALDADWEWHTFRTDDGVTGDPRDFIRLKVSVAP